MMSRPARVACALAALALLVPTTGCRAEGTPEPSPNDPSSMTLVEQPKEYDGTDVTFIGEVVGEAMKRGDMAWLHINDDPYYLMNVEEGAQLGGYNSGMAVWLDAELTEKITYYGDYKHEGDVVEVAGVFNAACPEHGGDMDIHARSLEMVRVGHVVIDPVHPWKIAWAIGLSLVAAGVGALMRLSRDHPIDARR
ncbi:MAG: hypothetical protein ACYC6J_04395 [Coriobacteriia bacterium]